MKVIAEWLELSVKQYDDGSFEAYESLTDTREDGTWEQVRDWIKYKLLSETEDEINKRE